AARGPPLGPPPLAARCRTPTPPTPPPNLPPQLGAYRSQDGAVTALILLLLCFTLFTLIENLPGRQAKTD
ncbi:hypothetical protein C9F10_04215, partial [Salmonella enterica subsp. enterica serovar Poona]